MIPANNGPLFSSLRSYWPGEPVTRIGQAEVYYRVISEKKAWPLQRRSYQLEVLLLLSGKEIPFEALASAVLAAMAQAGKAPGQAAAAWLVCSPSGGIYLYEALATKAHRKIKTLTNRFVVLDTEDGTVSFGPGHLDNDRFSTRLRALLASKREIPPTKWQAELGSFLELCFNQIR